MTGVLGPNSYRPGQILKHVEGIACDQHEDRPSVARVVGESDSFGSEVIDLCQECLDKLNTDKEETIGVCEICHTTTVVNRRRDPEEGSCGRIYNMCDRCFSDISNNF